MLRYIGLFIGLMCCYVALPMLYAAVANCPWPLNIFVALPFLFLLGFGVSLFRLTR